MAYTNVWDNALPLDSAAANSAGAQYRATKIDIQQRLADIWDIPDFTVDPLRPFNFKFSDVPTFNDIIGGAASGFRFRNIANNANNLLLDDLGNLGIRGDLTVEGSLGIISDLSLAGNLAVTGTTIISSLQVNSGIVSVPSATPFNIGLGYQVLTSNTTGFNNLALGYQALKLNTSGANNLALGYQALIANTAGNTNTAIGTTSMFSNKTGENNTAIGVDSLYTNTDGYSNTALGSNAQGFGDHGYENTAVGWRASFNGGAGVGNASVGVTALNDNLTGTFNVAVGHSALHSALGSWNIGLGHSAGYYETGSNSLYIDSLVRADLAASRAGALLYGTFNTTPSNQTLIINAGLTVTYGITTTSIIAGGSVAISAADQADSRLTIANTTSGTNWALVAGEVNVGQDGFQIYEAISHLSALTISNLGAIAIPGTLLIGNKLTTIASSTAHAGLNIPHGAAPTSPVNGDIWTTSSGLFIRINGVTKTVTLT